MNGDRILLIEVLDGPDPGIVRHLLHPPHRPAHGVLHLLPGTESSSDLPGLSCVGRVGQDLNQSIRQRKVQERIIHSGWLNISSSEMIEGNLLLYTSRGKLVVSSNF